MHWINRSRSFSC